MASTRSGSRTPSRAPNGSRVPSLSAFATPNGLESPDSRLFRQEMRDLAEEASTSNSFANQVSSVLNASNVSASSPVTTPTGNGTGAAAANGTPQWARDAQQTSSALPSPETQQRLHDQQEACLQEFRARSHPIPIPEGTFVPPPSSPAPVSHEDPFDDANRAALLAGAPPPRLTPLYQRTRNAATETPAPPPGQHTGTTGGLDFDVDGAGGNFDWSADSTSSSSAVSSASTTFGSPGLSGSNDESGVVRRLHFGATNEPPAAPVPAPRVGSSSSDEDERGAPAPAPADRGAVPRTPLRQARSAPGSRAHSPEDSVLAREPQSAPPRPRARRALDPRGVQMRLQQRRQGQRQTRETERARKKGFNLLHQFRGHLGGQPAPAPAPAPDPSPEEMEKIHEAMRQAIEEQKKKDAEGK